MEAKVLLLNDDRTTMEFVVQVLEDILGKTREEALRMVLQHHMRVSAQVGELLLTGARGKPDGPLSPRRDDRGDMRPAIGPDSGNPEQLGGCEDPLGLLPLHSDRSGVAVPLVERGDWRRHRHLSNRGIGRARPAGCGATPGCPRQIRLAIWA